MTDEMIATQTRAAAFDTVAEADRAVRDLLAAGFSKNQLAVLCPARFRPHFAAEAPHVEAPSGGPTAEIAVDGAIGATLGGVALAATVATGGAAGVVMAGLLIGGGALAGVFSNIFAVKGYEHEGDAHCEQALARGQIVVGVETQGDDDPEKLAVARQILDDAGAKELWPA